MNFSVKVFATVMFGLLATSAFAQQTGLLRCEDGKGGVSYVEKFCPEGYKGVKDVRSRTKTEVEMDSDLNKSAPKKPQLTEAQARRCVGRKSELEAMKKRLTGMEVGPKYDEFAKRVQNTEAKYEAECKRAS
ncbi:MAG: hypothetical protein RL341_2195 [Pseudomonadota bacterium]|jgi:hypothetical protein